MSGESSSTNDISVEKVKKLLDFVEHNRKKRASVKAHRHDVGECWSLPYVALLQAGVDTPCRNCGDEAYYVWGRRIDRSALKAGDIIQIEGAAYIDNKDATRELQFPHEHHSMIVVTVEAPGTDGPIVKVAHQWKGQHVFYSTIRLGSKRGSGVLHYYRPQSTR